MANCLRYDIFKGVTYSKRFTLGFSYISKKQLSRGGCGRFSDVYVSCMIGWYCRDDDADYRHDNTNNPYCRFYHQILYLSEIFQMYHPQNTGSSQNVLILAKGEPLTV